MRLRLSVQSLLIYKKGTIMVKYIKPPIEYKIVVLHSDSETNNDTSEKEKIKLFTDEDMNFLKEFQEDLISFFSERSNNGNNI